MLALRHLTVLHVVGTRPNFMKVAPVMRALAVRKGFRSILVHTGQLVRPNHQDAEPDFRKRPPRPDRPQGAMSRRARVFRPRARLGRFRPHDDPARQQLRPDGT